MQQKIYLIGPMGAGKTTLGKKLSELLRFDFLDTDELVTATAGCSMTQIIANFDTEHFRTLESQAIKAIATLTNVVVATGGGCILNLGTREFLAASGLVCYLKVNLEQQLQRLLDDTQRALLPAVAQARYEFLQQMQITRDALYNSIATVTLDTSTLTIDTATQALLAAITQNYAHD